MVVVSRPLVLKVVFGPLVLKVVFGSGIRVWLRDWQRCVWRTSSKCVFDCFCCVVPYFEKTGVDIYDEMA